MVYEVFMSNPRTAIALFILLGARNTRQHKHRRYTVSLPYQYVCFMSVAVKAQLLFFTSLKPSKIIDRVFMRLAHYHIGFSAG